MTNDLARAIDSAWDARESLGPSTKGEARDAVEAALAELDNGSLRVAGKIGGEWIVHQWLKKAVLLSFRLNDMKIISDAPGGAVWWDKVDSKFLGWDEARFRAAGFRAVPGAIVRRSAFIAKGVVLMPSFVNVGARVGEGTMIDTWATVGSCAQVGAHCHISGGAGLGGVLEPLQAAPTIIEDNCFIGARAEVAEGVIVGEGSVLSMGVYLSASTKIVDRATRRNLPGQGAALFGGGVRARCPARKGSPIALLRRDREAGGRKDPRQDLDQRIAAHLMIDADRPHPGPDPLSVGDAGRCGRAGGAGSGAEAAGLCLPSPALRAGRHAADRKSLCPAGHGRAAFLLRRPHRCGAAGRRLGARSLRRRDFRWRAVRARRRRHEIGAWRPSRRRWRG